MASIEDVAKKARVSVTTVSRTLNDHPYVSDKTKKKIYAAMAELDYYPNNIAQQLRGKASKMIGVIISYITNPFFAYLVDSIETTALESGYHLVVLQTQGKHDLEKFYTEMIKKKQLDGIIITNLETATPEIKALIDTGKVVICNRYIGNERLPVIHIDEEEASYTGTKYLINQGHKQIAFCTGNVMNTHDRRFKGFSKALKEFKLDFDENLFFEKTLDVEDGRNFLRWFAKQDSIKRPTAVFSNGDQVAAGIISEAHKYQINIPEDLSVLGFDDQPIATLTSPEITTIRQPIQTMGEYATKTLIAKLENCPLPANVDLKTEIIHRESVHNLL
ncbi:DNA-binding LacI/PurR family transcriptional regulator [Enterococcus sp. PF1-24]|uniref:LacI family DNA-binding transcriptional regulator n=1 Tax=unclassified Enterococcus TaxID=2608891 RepID=UPI002474AEED|nr:MULTISPECIES: LacI family DNA-binding transcriptional regulator [unclassified Enterococcus]MDH6363787.1 DNA-binding LacI/PurR family transcriptional regulator [Enterococcus sp. PFB1-1]MDH6400743.1 DNA-binding LacI/PurR family transcriptional regulator [Enterococcus sp. PF1-24]